MRLALIAALCALALAAPPAFAQSLNGPPGTSLDKVLVIGTDGTRWDLLEKAMKAGRAPNLARLRREGFGRPSRLAYADGTLTLSEVGWSSIASGVWEDKHLVDGTRLNMDPDQATKGGYHDFLTRIERARPRLSTFLAVDWDNLGLPVNGGPIFGTAMDANFSHRVPVETIAEWDRGDVAVTRAARRYLRYGNPDAGFVYLGLVDETAHLAGSATPTYATAIGTTDARIGQLLRGIRGRASYAFESWTILVTTDHGERPLTEPSILAHYGDTPLERTVFVIGTGPGLEPPSRKSRVVDIAPTVLHQLGLRVSRSWRLDGRTLSEARRPSSSATARLRGGRLVVRLRLGSRPKARAIDFHLPARVSGRATVRVNGELTSARIDGKAVRVDLHGRKLRTISLTADTGTARRPVVVILRGGRGGKMAIPVS